MTFFSRPNLENLQFKQLEQSTLTLSGQTQIATTSGLTLTDGAGGYVPIIATGGTNNDVLTYRDGQILLLEPTASGGTGIYPYNQSATTTVGGLLAGTNLYNVPVVDILQDILVPTLYPTLTAPTSSLSVTPTSTIHEVGSVIVFTFNTGFDRGCICPAYCGGPDKRSGLPSRYVYFDYNGYITGVSSTSLSNTYVMSNREIDLGNNIGSVRVEYSCGLQPLNSNGDYYSSPLPSGSTSTITRTICGIYPWFYGSSVGVPTINSTLLTTATCSCVGLSTGDIIATNYNVTGQYIWFAIPSTSTSMLKWQGSNSPSNCGTIPGDLFASETTCAVNSPSSCWSGVNYRFYVSNYPTNINYCMTFKRS